MQDFLQHILQKVNCDSQALQATFGPRLSQKDELMLSQLSEEIKQKVDAMLETALAGIEPEIMLSQSDKSQIMELNAIRKSIHQLIQEYGSMGEWQSLSN